MLMYYNRFILVLGLVFKLVILLPNQYSHPEQQAHSHVLSTSLLAMPIKWHPILQDCSIPQQQHQSTYVTLGLCSHLLHVVNHNVLQLHLLQLVRIQGHMYTLFFVY
jgi:hypothetical protein